MGWSDNRNVPAVEPRLPAWLAWFDTPDNSLWGDHGWRTIHCPAYKSYFGMVRWLWRNHGYGFKWSKLAARVSDPACIEWEGDPRINRNNGRTGVFEARMGKYWQYKWVKRIGRTGYCISLNFGWLLDAYVTDPACHYEQPLALFLFSPRLGRIKQ